MFIQELPALFPAEKSFILPQPFHPGFPQITVHLCAEFIEPFDETLSKLIWKNKY